MIEEKSMSEQRKIIHDDNNGLDYVLVGDYYIPMLALPEENRPIGYWGILRKEYLKKHKSGMYSYLLLTGKLDRYLADLNEQAQERYELIEAQMRSAEGVTEKLKAQNPMEWVRQCNNIRNRVQEIVLSELVYVEEGRMRYRIEYADGRCCNFANSRKDLLDWLKLLKDEQIVDIRKIYKSGVTDSVLDSYRCYLKQ